jgi:hypothetical protein
VNFVGFVRVLELTPNDQDHPPFDICWRCDATGESAAASTAVIPA